MNEEIQKTFGHRLRVRASGISILDQKVLLVGLTGLVSGGLYWCPPGGGISYGESAREAVAREIREETGVQAKTGRFMFLKEFLSPPLHALELYFEAKITDVSKLKIGSDPEITDGHQLISEVDFFSLDEIKKLPREAVDSIFHHLPSLEYLQDANYWSTIQKELI